MPILKSVKVKLSLPYLADVEGTWEPDEQERAAAWEMYVELITRVSLEHLRPDEGLLREAFSSLYTVFDATRQILRKHGPTVAVPKGGYSMSFGLIAVSVLNGALRPVLTRWHPLLLDYENARPVEHSPYEYELRWKHYDQVRNTLNNLRDVLAEYADVLARVAGVPSLVIPEEEQDSVE